MRVEKVQIPAKIYCDNGILIVGVIHLAEGERTLDLANDQKRNFMPVTKVELYYTEGPHFVKATSDLVAKKDVIILNKSSVRWIEEET